MSNLGLETAPATAKKKNRMETAQMVFVSLLIAFFTWTVVSNGFLLIFQKPLISAH